MKYIKNLKHGDKTALFSRYRTLHFTKKDVFISGKRYLINGSYEQISKNYILQDLKIF